MAKVLKGTNSNANYSLKENFVTKTNEYSYTSAGSLYAWYQFAKDVSSSGDLDDLSGNDRDLTARDSDKRPAAPTTDSPTTGYPTAPNGFPAQSAVFNADLLEHADDGENFTFGDGTDDSPFSISVWVKVSDNAAHQIAAKYKNSAAGIAYQREWVLSISASTIKPRFLIQDESNNNTQWRDGTNAVQANVWTHIVATYDGRGGSGDANDVQAGPGIKIYKNGVDDTNDDSGSDTIYVAMENTLAPFTIGNSDDEPGAKDFDGSLASVALWSKVLSADEVKALYHSRTEGMGKKTSSGIISSPARIQLRDIDRRENQYPRNARTTGHHLGNEGLTNLPFNDTNTIPFLSPFATAVITFQNDPVIGDFIDLTGSLGTVSKRFVYTDFDESPNPHLEDATVGHVMQTVGIPKIDSLGAIVDSPAKAASEFVRFVSSDSLLEMEAFYKPKVVERLDTDGTVLTFPKVKHEVLLRHRRPCTGSFEGHQNTIRVGNAVISPTPTTLRATQFVQGLTGEVHYPDLVQTSDSLTHLAIASPNTRPTLSTTASLMPGITDQRYVPSSSYTIDPFDESRVSIDTNNTFYDTGTSKTILEGFESPLKSKTQIVISLSSSNGMGTRIYQSTGSNHRTGFLVGPQGTIHPEITSLTGSGMAYFSPSKSSWEMLNPISPDPFANPTFAADKKATMGFSVPSTSASFDSGDEARNRHLARLSRGYNTPISNHGFPVAAQYNATSSQCLDMSNYIKTPFLLEKIRVEIEGVFGMMTGSRSDPSCAQSPNPALNMSSSLPMTKVFFILNQTSNGDDPHISASFTVSGKVEDPIGTLNVFADDTQTIHGARELITWAKIGFAGDRHYLFNNTDGVVESAEKIIRDDYESFNKITSLHFEGPHDKPNGYLGFGFSGSIGFNLFPKLGLSNAGCSFSSYRGTTTATYPQAGQRVMSNPLGGADLQGNASGRQIASSLDSVDNEISSSAEVHPAFDPINTKTSFYRVSPYLLKPTDKLIFGWQNIMPFPVDASCMIEQDIADKNVDRIKNVKITMFGSMVRAGKEYHDTLNQNITSNEVHEVILGAPVVDQFDVEPVLSLSGSTFDSLFHGTMKNDGFGTGSVRGRRASIARGQAGSTGSLSRNIGFFNEEYKIKDSLTPPISFLLNIPLFFTGTGNFSAFGEPADPNTVNGLNVKLQHPSIVRNEGSTAISALVLSNNPLSSSFKLLMATGLHNIKTYNSNLVRSPASNYLEVDGGGVATVADHLAFDTTYNPTGLAADTSATYQIFSGTVGYAKGVSSEFSSTTATPAATVAPKLLDSPEIKFAISSLFYAAPLQLPGRLSWPVRRITGATGAPGLVPAIRGFKHGFFSTTPKSPVVRFKRDHYGYFRDMVEQAPETAVVGLVDLDQAANLELVGTDVDGPVHVIFTSREGTQNIDPSDTNTQNLSAFCTSSVPYTDGLSLERDINNNPPPDMTDVTSIEEAVAAIIDGSASS